MIRVVITNDQGDEIYTATFADFADAGAWIDGVMKADDSASHVFTENTGEQHQHVVLAEEPTASVRTTYESGTPDAYR